MRRERGNLAVVVSAGFQIICQGSAHDSVRVQVEATPSYHAQAICTETSLDNCGIHCNRLHTNAQRKERGIYEKEYALIEYAGSTIVSRLVL